jgi:hypothetical protein
MHKIWDCIWLVKHIGKDGNILSEERIPNALVDSGEKALIDTFLRNNGATYFSVDKLYVGLYHGTISESTILSTVPGEPSSSGYARQTLTRNNDGWPTIEQDDGDWRTVSAELTITASGGDIGPITGAFLTTPNTLICSIASPIERTILDGESLVFQLRVKCS